MLCAVPFLFTLATALVIDPPRRPTIENITYTGSGCPSNSLWSLLSSYLDTTTNAYPFTIGLGDPINPPYGTGIPVTETRRNCQITVSLKSEEGLRVRVNQLGTTVVGWSRLGEKGTVLTAMVSYGFSGNPTESSGYITIPGPQVGPFRQTMPPPDVGNPGVVSPCSGGILNVRVQTRITSTVKSGVGWIGDPEPGETDWKLVTGIEGIPC